MRKQIIAAFTVATTLLTLNAEETAQTLYFDFGPQVAAQNGTLTEGADTNGHYWNNITNNSTDNKYAAKGTVYDNLVNSENAATGFRITLNSRFSTNGKSGGGGLLAPEADLLGDLAVASATEDYFFIESNENNSNFTISGLDPTKSYRFHVFASRKATDNRTGTYTVEGINKASGDLQAAGTGIGHGGENQNTSDILVCDPVFPDDNGEIIFTVSRKTGAYIPINAMKMEELTGGTRPVATPKVVAAVLTGTAAENGQTVAMRLISPDGKNNGIFECFTMLQPGSFCLSATTDDDQTVSYGVTAEGKLFADADVAYPVETQQLSMIRADFTNATVTVTPITSCAMTGSAVHGWNTSNVEELPYVGNGVWKGEVTLTNRPSVSDRSRFNFLLNNSWDYKLSRVSGTANSVGLSSDGFTLADIYLNFGRYVITLDLNEFVYHIEAADGIDENRITVMGSSVSNGQGATDNQGYAYMFDNLLTSRLDNSLSENPFFISSIAVNGNNTVNLLNRYDELVNDFSRYVIFGVSLGNEGIHGAPDQEAVYNQFATNMQTLIAKAREDGMIPVVMNNYTRGDFGDSDYEYVRRMNMLINSWDVPSVNLLGAIDNGSGNWADGYQNGDDIYHPDTKGHVELFHAIVPSLFDALKAGKTIPVRLQGKSVKIGDNGKIEFTPDDEVHPFALVLTLADLPEGCFATISTPAGDATLFIRGNTLTYTSPSGETISGEIPHMHTSPLSEDVAVASPLTVTLSHYHAQGRTLLYANDSLLGQLAEKVTPGKVTVAPATGKSLNVGELMFYRSALNHDEVKALNDGKMLQSSLEIYLPFTDSSNLSANHAQSMTEATVNTGDISGMTTVTGEEASAPFKATGGNGTMTLCADSRQTLSIHTPSGSLTYRVEVAPAANVTLTLPAGLYLVGSPTATAKVIVK